MKKLTIEQKAEAYDNLIERLKDFRFEYRFSAFSDTIERYFPELKESDGEKIRKEIIEYFKHYSGGDNVSIKFPEWIIWLQKQGEHQNFRDSIQIGDKVTRNKSGELVNLSQLNRVAKPADNVEPKFKVGDWIIKNDDSSINIDYGCCKITKVENGNYTRESIYGYKGYNTFETLEKDYHLWTIKDAKDGDVLVYPDGSLTIFNYRLSGLDAGLYMAHVLLTYKLEFKQTCTIKDVKLATKEQRDTLEKAMADARYTFDFENKELKKIEPKFKVGDWVTDGVSKCQIRFIDDTQYWYSENCCILGNIESIDKRYRLWTIKDAKDGDILVTPNYIYIFNSIDEETETVAFYCLMKKSNEHFSFGDDKIHSEILDSVPATKEQRSLLFAKMKEAGHKWDDEKKELEKIENETEIPFGAYDSELQEATYYIPKGFHAEIGDDKVVIKKGEKSTAWSE